MKTLQNRRGRRSIALKKWNRTVMDNFAQGKSGLRGWLDRPPSRGLAIALAILVTLLWASSWVLIKIGLQDIPALTFGGLRYALAALILLPFALRSKRMTSLCQLSRGDRLRLILLAFLFITVTQGAIFLSLAYLPAIPTNLMMSLSGVIIALLGILLLKEIPRIWHWFGIVLYSIGLLLFFYPTAFPAGNLIGVLAALIGVLANSFSSILGRYFNRQGKLDPVTLSAVTMGFGGILLLSIGVVFQGMPTISLRGWAIVLWLAAINSALAFSLWNLSLKTLTAVQSGVINNLLVIEIPILAVLFLGESLSIQQGFAILLALLGVTFVQLKQPHTSSPTTSHKSS
jgi:drug/metabolite transporter (DMT)-like permease